MQGGDADKEESSAEEEPLPQEEGEGGEGGVDGEEAGSDEELFPVLQLQLPAPTHTKVRTSVYLRSTVKHEDCPPPIHPEFAVIGRSNVGKSSLINMLTNSKKLAHVSKEPGKTRCINHFLINDSWYFVDLPGYGYARVDQAQREVFEAFTRDYFKERSNLTMVLLLIDSTIKPQKVDLDYAAWLTNNEVPFCLVFTKTDKRRKGQLSKTSNMTEFKRELLKSFEYLPPSIATSSEDGTGKAALLHFIASLRVASEQHFGVGQSRKRRSAFVTSK